jgi:hypothetical protein
MVSCSISGGVSNQLLMVPSVPVLLKFAPMYDASGPAWAGKTAGLPWTQAVGPGG